MRSNYIVRYVWTLVVITAGAFSAMAQGDAGRISGTVTDVNGAIVAGATVTVTSQATGEVRTVSVNGEGSFTVINLKPNKYTVTATAANFEQVRQTDVTVRTG